MNLSARDQYFETQVTTATSQRLRLMLIDGGLRTLRRTIEAWQQGKTAEGEKAVEDCRGIVAELIGGIQPEATPVAKRVLGVYLFVYSTLVEAQLSKDVNRLQQIVRVLEEERETWQQLCEQMPDQPVREPSMAQEEIAPQRVTDVWTPGFSPSLATHSTSGSALSLEA